MTGRQQWTNKAQEYAKWKSHVLASLLDAVRGTDFEPLIVRNIGTIGKPFNTKNDYPMRLDIFIHWNDARHGDPENVFGSIADALFKQDKWLKGSFDFSDEPSNPAFVECKITLLK